MQFTNFTVAYWCVFIAALLPLGCAGLAKWQGLGKPLKDGGYDNHDPRRWLARQTDWKARANAAQANSFEALPFFIGAVLIAHQLGMQQPRLDVLAFVFVLLRVVYILLYLADQANARSAVWTLALGVNVAILFAGYL